MLEKKHSAGQLRAIGVSNYTVRHLQELLEVAKITPHVNQVKKKSVFRIRIRIVFARSESELVMRIRGVQLNTITNNMWAVLTFYIA